MHFKRLGIAVLLLAVTLAGGAGAESQEGGSSPLLVIFDASGSMWGQIGGENKIVIARRVLGGVVDGLADGSEVGLIAYGHRREGDCEDIETIVPMAPIDKAALKSTVDGINPKGKTPITKALKTAFATLAGRTGGSTVILVSDGLETCGGDPCAAVRTAKAAGAEFLLHVVGFDVAGEDVSQLECAAQAGEGLFLSAESAEELSAAIDKAVALAPTVSAGRLSVRAIADGELQDAAVLVADAATGEEAADGRTYASPDTNPRLIPLPDGKFRVTVQAVGIKGDVTREFEIEIADGSRVEKTVDFSTGKLTIGVTRNGELSDAVFKVRLPGSGEEVASGRTYTAASSNPAEVRLTSGTYVVEVGSVEITGGPRADLGEVALEPGGSLAVSHAWQSGTLKIGAARGGELVDATLNIASAETGKAVGQGRTYKSATSNPKAFELLPGAYRVTVSEIRGPRRVIEVTVGAGEVVERMVDPAGSE